MQQVGDRFHGFGIAGAVHCQMQGLVVPLEFCSQLLRQLVGGVFRPGQPEVVNPHALEDLASLNEARQVIPVLMGGYQQMNIPAGRRLDVCGNCLHDL